jgi:hypothetical protein
MMELTKGNRRVWYFFLKAKGNTKQEMARVLKEQLDNLQILYDMMDKELDVMALDTTPPESYLKGIKDNVE